MGMQMLRMWALGVAVAGGMAIAAAACGGSSDSAAPAPSPVPGAANTLTISNNAISPQTITVTRGSQVTIVNSDTRSHQMESDPHPEHTDCPELNQIGFLNAGQSRQSGNLNTARKCGMHDHNSPETAGLKATITIQ